jgi:phosphatidate cytidylyltransferase
MLRSRFFSALLLCAVLAGALFADVYLFHYDCCFLLVWLAGTALALHEFYALARTAGMSPFRRFGIGSGLLLVLCTWFSPEGRLAQIFSPEVEAALAEHLVPAGLVLGVFGTLFLQALKRDNGRTFESVSSTLFGLLYLGYLPSFALRLRHLGVSDVTVGGTTLRFSGVVDGGGNWLTLGTWLVVALIAGAKLSDAAAYFGGSSLGRHRLIPRISPRKTWEGVVAGLLGGMLTLVVLQQAVLGRLSGGRLTLVEALIFGAAMSFVGQLGDLAESLLKRGGGLKDSGSLLPGLGGSLDVVDSLVGAAPAAWFLALAFLRS